MGQTREPSAARLRAEFAFLYVLAPVSIALLLPATAMFPALFLVTAVGALLLNWTKNFRWKWLIRGLSRVRLWEVLAFTCVVFLFSLMLVYKLTPDSAFFLVQENPRLMLMIGMLYPLVSALPQELVYRPLFFRRYKRILPTGGTALVINAALFALAHLMYWNWIVIFMTFFGGLAFAWAYEIRRSFPMAVILHSVAGVVIFAVGLGIFFYSGNVERPF
jgi:membrane protease YdiL (CAAX protease family)